MGREEGREEGVKEEEEVRKQSHSKYSICSVTSHFFIGGSSSSVSSSHHSTPLSGSSGSSSGKSVSAYGNGGGKPITISSGQPFAGRSAGGADRSTIYGTR